MIFGEHGVRVKNNQDYYGWWQDPQQDRPGDQLDIIALSDDIDLAAPLAQVVVPAGSQVIKVGDDLLVSLRLRYIYDDNHENDYYYQTDVKVFNLADPTAPRLAAEFTTDELVPFWGGYYYGGWGLEDCWGCYDYYPTTSTLATSNALVIPQAVQHQESEGMEEVCYSYAEDNTNNCWTEEGPQACSYVTGSRSCSSLNGQEPYCSGSFYRCTQSDDGQTQCEPISEDGLTLRESCYTHERFRYWWHYRLQVLDLRQPERPVLGEPIDMDADKEGVSALVNGDDLYVTWRRPAQIQGDSRPYVRYFFERLDLTDPATPALDAPVNIPGVLMAVDNGGRTLFTQDFVWGDEIVETAINKLSVRDGRAYLDARRRFEDQYVSSLRLDARGNLLVSHRAAWRAYQDNQEQVQKLSVLNARSRDFEVRAEVDVDLWAELRDVRDGRALFSVPGGLLIMNLDDPTAPVAQAYFPVQGWPRQLLLEGGDVYFAAGRYGMYRFNVGAQNLLR